VKRKFLEWAQFVVSSTQLNGLIPKNAITWLVLFSIVIDIGDLQCMWILAMISEAKSLCRPELLGFSLEARSSSQSHHLRTWYLDVADNPSLLAPARLCTGTVMSGFSFVTEEPPPGRSQSFPPPFLNFFLLLCQRSRPVFFCFLRCWHVRAPEAWGCCVPLERLPVLPVLIGERVSVRFDLDLCPCVDGVGGHDLLPRWAEILLEYLRIAFVTPYRA
jgi:hypothetical protein